MADVGSDSAQEGGSEASTPSSSKRVTSLLSVMEISVTEPERRTGVTAINMKETYTVYLVETRITDMKSELLPETFTDETFSLWRRYSEFELLRNYLCVTYPAVVIPPLPEKKIHMMWQKLSGGEDKFDPDFIERRRAGLESFLLRVAAHGQLSQDKIFHCFLHLGENWKETVLATGYQNKMDSRLKTLNAQFRLKNPDRRFQDLKNYSSELEANIANLLKIRERLAERLYGIHKIHANYGRVFSEWSGIEKEMGDGLQSAGHFMDVYAASIDSMLEEEDTYADALKEYLYFADALRSICRKQELLQYEVEKLEDKLVYLKAQKEQMEQGGDVKSGFSLKGMTTKLFGADTPETRDKKIKLLEEQTQQTEEQLQAAKWELSTYIDRSLQDVERFKRQKVRDLREIFINYSIMQIKLCKKGISLWNNTKECFTKM
ncbi:sorting nexin-4-like isoform X2 [Branchiostoma floridae]|uniref:Sorting nexin-4-like isoform X2 n=2 Tax=Branchiostoma floridae TaxID=7739 RepID=A0A9J7MFE3_BRAFL|nr:sorting nexin-4-like isoform X2 [Branchiostoma floridae]